MMKFEDALNHILKSVVTLGTERINILDALGRVLAEDVYAPRNIPPHDNSAMDGYALTAEDTMGASGENPLFFEIIEDIPAGYMPQKIVGFGEASRIMTGAPMPQGADAVVRVEDTELEDGRVKISQELSISKNVRYSGEDVTEGECVLNAGKVIRPAEVGMLSSLGRSFIKVYRKPLVAILASGDELIDVDGIPAPEKIVNSNSYSIAAQVIECGGIPLHLGIARDTREDITAQFREALRADIIVSSAGVSVGDYDFVEDAMKELNISVDFRTVAQRPGKPFTFGTIDAIPVFGLPGNPVSSMVSFEQYVRPTILKMTGHTKLFRRTVQAVLNEDIAKKKGLRYFLRAVVTVDNGIFTVVTTGGQGSGILKSMVRANGIMVLPEELTAVKAGDTVTVQLIDNLLELTATPGYL
jgi:molybdopterin molybdotransferase